MPEHKHWEWARKVRAATAGSVTFGVAVSGEMQGLMLIRTDKLCRLPQQAGLPMAYVDYLSTAPWNLPILNNSPRFRSIGTLLMAAATAFSQQRGWDGRIGLHALRQAASFYRDKCGMTDLGQDANYQRLRYFEMTATQAAQLGKANP